MKRIVLALGLVLALATIASAATVELTWTAVATVDLKEYEVGIGTVSGTYPTPIVVAKTLTTHVFPIASDGTYYTSVRSVDNAGNKSAWAASCQASVDTTPPAVPTGVSCRVIP